MKDNDIDWFVVFSRDEHLSEYTGESDRYIRSLTGFTGSAGTLVVGAEGAWLWTDSRYHIQAENQLRGKDIELMRSGIPGVLTMEDFLSEHVWDGQRIAMDLKTVSFFDYSRLQKKIPFSAETVDGEDILKASKKMPSRVCNEIVPVPANRCGKSALDKLEGVRKKIKKEFPQTESYTYLISDLTSVMWLFNLRGSDIAHVPVAYSYAAITPYSASLYIHRKQLTKEASDALEEAGIIVKEYSRFYKELDDIATDIVFADSNRNNTRIIRPFEENQMFTACSDPSFITKSVKCDSEIAGMKSAHQKDAVTMIRFIKLIKEMASNGELPNEYELGKILDKKRLENGCSDTSFDTICAYGPNSAIVHYVASEKDCSPVSSKGFLLVDSGGQYMFEGTTDITRTISLGEVCDEEKRVYTTVLKGNLRLMDAIFPEGCEGTLLDAVAEQPLWENGYFCGHGIGHGVGCNLSVHESEARISRRTGSGEIPITSGVIISDEPGVYLEGKFGVRIENLLLAVKSDTIGKNRMCSFKPLTLVPYDSESIDSDMLDEKEKDMLMRYNRLIIEKICPLLTGEEAEWLEEYMKKVNL